MAAAYQSTTTPQAMRDVIWALLPATLAAVWYFGLCAVLLIGGAKEGLCGEPGSANGVTADEGLGEVGQRGRSPFPARGDRRCRPGRQAEQSRNCDCPAHRTTPAVAPS